MEKFSIYEFMSFFLPGVAMVCVTLQLLPAMGGYVHHLSPLADGLMFTMISLLAGLAIHQLTFMLLNFKWYKKLTYKSVLQITKENPEDIKVNFDKINKFYNEESLDSEYLFDKAYYYLEYKDKIATAKTFQGMYFFLRNLVTICLVFLPMFVGAIICTNGYYLFIIGVFFSIILIFVLSFMAGFYRRQMVKRIFNTFYIALEIEKSQ
jgi:hypothetical protein